MTLVTVYAVGRVAFGGIALLAPAATGRMLAGEGGATPDAQAFLRGMGGREIAIGLGLLREIRNGGPLRPWLIAGVLADSGDTAGIAGAWQHMAPSKRWSGLTLAGVAAAVGLGLLATDRAP
jgi:peptide-methionine (R)-S-oxide reductase